MSSTLPGKEISLKIKIKKWHSAFQTVFRWECSTHYLNVRDQPGANAQVNGCTIGHFLFVSLPIFFAFFHLAATWMREFEAFS